jgi:hypothetical protein
MIFLDFIDEEEKEKLRLKEEESKLPEKAIEKSIHISKSLNVSNIKNSLLKKFSSTTANKYDNSAIKKAQLKHGRIPTLPTNDEQQIHSLGFIDDI